MGKRKHHKRSRSRSRSRSTSKNARLDLEQRLLRLEAVFRKRHSSSEKSLGSQRSRSRSTTPKRRRTTNQGDRFSTLSPDHGQDSGSLDRSPSRVSDGPAEYSRITNEDGNDDVLLINNTSPLNQPERELEDSVLDILGKDPEEELPKAMELHLALQKRWSHILIEGLDKESVSELVRKYPAPKNLPSLEPPELNSEISEVISSLSLKRDKYQIQAQSQLRAGISAIGSVLDKILKNNDFDKSILQGLTDAGKLLIHTQRTLSLSRRHAVIPQLDRSVRNLALAGKIDTKLFGSDFTERRRAQKELQKNSQDLKATFTVENRKKSVSSRPHSLNQKGLSQVVRKPRHYRPQPQREHHKQNTRYRR